MIVACVHAGYINDRWLTCISQWTQTPDKVFHKLLLSFHMQKKKLLGLQRNQIFNQGSFFVGEGWGCKVIGRIVRTSEKILATPLTAKRQKWCSRCQLCLFIWSIRRTNLRRSTVLVSAINKGTSEQGRAGRLITKHLKTYYHASGVREQTPLEKIGIQVFRLQNSRVFFLK